MPRLDPLFIVISGKHDTGKTTVASFVKMFLEENGFRDVTIVDTPPLEENMKPRWWDRFQRNKGRPIRISVELLP